jgi:hypothetical protein
MCVVSMVTDHYRDKWPGIYPLIPLTPGEPFKINPSDFDKIFERINKPEPPKQGIMITADQWLEYMSLKNKAVEYDKRNNEPHCAKDGVAEWENDIESFLILMGLLTEQDFFRAGVGG